MIQIYGHGEETMKANYVMETRKVAQNLKKHHFRTSQNYQLVLIIHYFKTTKQKYLHVGIINMDNVDWVILTILIQTDNVYRVILILLKSHQVSFSMHLQILFILSCGYHQNLFLDSEGNVYSVGGNKYGQLGLGHNAKQNVLNKISNIPSIKVISCVFESCYLIDFEGNLWSFGDNNKGQLGHGDEAHLNAPKIINALKDIQQISYGCTGYHFFAKNSQNQIFVTGNNNHGQLGTGDTQSGSIPKEMDSKYSTIWRDEIRSRAKSARK